MKLHYHKIPIFYLKQFHINLKYIEIYVAIPKESTFLKMQKYNLKANREIKTDY